MSHEEGSFTVTESEIEFASVFAYASTIPGTVVCSLVLCAYGLVALPRRSRQVLDRVSFRLLSYSLVANVAFGIAFATTPAAPGTGCNVGAFFVNLTLFFATFFTTCIAINLHLVLVHSVNGKKMEKYYIIGTTFLSLILTVPTFALGQFGWSDVSATCWYSHPDPAQRLNWIIGTQSFWVALAATLEAVSSVVVLVWLYQSQRTIKRLLVGRFPKSIPSGAASGDGSRPSGEKRITISTNVADIQHQVSGTPSSLTEDPRFKRVVLRIVMYPLISFLANYSTVALDLHGAITGLETHLDFQLLVLNLTLYGLRPLAYGLLAAADPSFIGAVKTILNTEGADPQSSDSGTVATKLNFSPIESGHSFLSGLFSSGSRGAVDIEDGRVRSASPTRNQRHTRQESCQQWEKHI